MQQRRFRPGDVLDDYCPRERRITDHAIVAMIDDHIKQTRCVVCDAEHEYKDGKAPAHRRKKPNVLFSQVLEGLQGPHPVARAAPQADAEPSDDVTNGDAVGDVPLAASAERQTPVEEPSQAPPPVPPPAMADSRPTNDAPAREEGPWRRHLIRAALPRPEGQAPPPVTRPIPEFTVRQPNSRGPRHGRRRGGVGQQGMGGMQGPMRFGRDHRDQQGPGGPRQHNGRRRRGGKKR